MTFRSDELIHPVEQVLHYLMHFQTFGYFTILIG